MFMTRRAFHRWPSIYSRSNFGQEAVTSFSIYTQRPREGERTRSVPSKVDQQLLSYRQRVLRMGRSPCCSEKGVNSGAWSSREDMILSEYIRIHGDRGWRNLPQKAGLMRCGKSCRLRWVNYLRPDIKRGNISPDEDELIIRLHRLLGNRWSLIAGRLPGRTANEIKNYWNTRLTKKMLSMKQSEHGGRKNLKKGSTFPPLRNPVVKTIPVRIKAAARHPEIERQKGSNGYGCSYHSSDKAFKSCNVKETANSSKSCCDLILNDSIIAEDSDSIDFAAVDNLVERKTRNCTFSMSRLLDQRSPHSKYIAGLTESLLSLDKLSSPDCNLLSAPSYSGSKEFCREPAALVAETNEFEVVCFNQSNVQGVNGFTDADDQAMNIYSITHNR